LRSDHIPKSPDFFRSLIFYARFIFSGKIFVPFISFAGF